MSKTQLANHYEISQTTLRTWLTTCKFYEVYPEAKRMKILTVVHVKYIFDKLGND